jgi:hypothetical protein
MLHAMETDVIPVVQVHCYRRGYFRLSALSPSQSIGSRFSGDSLARQLLIKQGTGLQRRANPEVGSKSIWKGWVMTMEGVGDEGEAR